MPKINPPPSEALFVCDICGRTYNQTLMKEAVQEGYPVRTVCSYAVGPAAPTGGCFETGKMTKYVPPAEEPAKAVAVATTSGTVQ